MALPPDVLAERDVPPPIWGAGNVWLNDAINPDGEGKLNDKLDEAVELGLEAVRVAHGHNALMVGRLGASERSILFARAKALREGESGPRRVRGQRPSDPGALPIHRPAR